MASRDKHSDTSSVIAIRLFITGFIYRRHRSTTYSFVDIELLDIVNLGVGTRGIVIRVLLSGALYCTCPRRPEKKNALKRPNAVFMYTAIGYASRIQRPKPRGTMPLLIGVSPAA